MPRRSVADLFGPPQIQTNYLGDIDVITSKVTMDRQEEQASESLLISAEQQDPLEVPRESSDADDTYEITPRLLINSLVRRHEEKPEEIYADYPFTKPRAISRESPEFPGDIILPCFLEECKDMREFPMALRSQTRKKKKKMLHWAFFSKKAAKLRAKQSQISSAYMMYNVYSGDDGQEVLCTFNAKGTDADMIICLENYRKMFKDALFVGYITRFITSAYF